MVHLVTYLGRYADTVAGWSELWTVIGAGQSKCDRPGHSCHWSRTILPGRPDPRFDLA